MYRMRNRKAFTTVELVIVIAVIAVLATVLIPTFSNLIGQANDSKALQEAKNAHTNYLIENSGTAPTFMFYKAGERFVALRNGIPAEIYDNQDVALTALYDNPTTPSINEADGFELRSLSISGLYQPHRTKVFITNANLSKNTGSVNANDGKVTPEHTDNWYADIQIPNGAKQVRFLTFKTAQTNGSAFLNGSTYISGKYNTSIGGQWETIDIPENATIFRYCYLQDACSSNKNMPVFEYLEFVGQDIQPIPSIVKHPFSVKVDIAPALGEDSPVMATDYGYIMLPKNYTDDGEPTRLVIVCHGAGAVLSDYRSSSWKEHSQTYWLDMGYAIMDMYACPPELANDSELHYGNPTVLDCYEKGYQYVMENFNLKSDGVFVLGSSMGGFSSFQIVQSGKFPVLAQVANCPVIDLFKQAYCNPWESGTYQREKIAAYFNFEGAVPTFTTVKHIPSDAEINYFRENFEKVIPYSPIFAKVTSGDKSAIFDRLPKNATIADSEEAALYSQLTATHPCPLLIVHNKNDGTVSYRYSEYLYGMLSRGGATVELKLYDTGDHKAWDNGPQGAIKNYEGELVQHSESRRLAIEFFRQYEP